MKYIACFATAGCLFGGGLLAQELVFSPVATESCLARATKPGAQADCIGKSADACMDATQGGWSTVGMGGCLDAEWQYWDARLNASYKRSMAAAREIDAEMGDLGANVPKQADALRAMQRAWIPFRDAKCDYAYSQWGGGTGGGPASTSCMMVTTAEQTLYLESSTMGE